MVKTLSSAGANHTISYEGTKAETLTFNNLDTTYDSYVKAQGSNAQIIFKDLKTLNFKTDYKFISTPNNNNPIISSSGGSVRRTGHRDRQFRHGREVHGR